MWNELKVGFSQRKGFAYILLLASLGIGYFSPLAALILFAILRKREAQRIYGYCAILGGILALVLYLIQSITV